MLALASTAHAQAGAPATPAEAPAAAAPTAADDGTIVVTGYRASLEQSTRAKRESVGFTDAIFAEDMGKFPDTNIAESLNRIPGVTINREISGEGLTIAIRGLGPNFTRVLLNNAPVAIASTGRTDAASTNREVDLDLMPTELFTQLTVSKSPSAGTLEGGAAGTVNLRSARPFDRRGSFLSYSAMVTKGSNASKWGYRGSLIGSWTNESGTFGVLLGAAGVRNQFHVSGFETIGWTNPNLSTPNSIAGTTNGVQNVPTAAQILAAQCRANNSTCNSTGGGNWTIPGTVPANAGNGLTVGDSINQDLLLAKNPGATIQQIDNGLIPRLGRPAEEFGTKDRYSFVGSVEFRPSDALHFYVDSMYGKKSNNMDRIDMNWVVRNSATIPLNQKFDRTDCATGCVVTQGTYANAQFFLEYRPYKERVEFYGVNPGLDFEVNDWISGDLQANYAKSTFRRESPTVLVSTVPSSGITVEYTNTSGEIPTIKSNVDLNNPANFGWPGGRVNVQAESREIVTKGIRGSLKFGGEKLNVRVGGAYDDIRRSITAFDNTQAWQNAVCGNNPSVLLPGPNTQPPCNGATITGSAAAVNAINSAYPAYPGFGTGFTAGQTGLTYAGSLIPNATVPSLLKSTPYGFITVDWDKFRAASKYDQFLASAPEAGAANTGATGGFVQEKVLGLFAEANGLIEFGDNKLKLNGGMRYVRTDQTLGGRVSLTDTRNPANTTAANGGLYPNVVSFVYQNTDYENWLPSASASIEFGEHVVARAALSRTMTRADPNAMLPGLNFSAPSADTGSVGNPGLSPYISANIDIGFEYYTGREGVIGVAAFRKSISGFTSTQTVNVPFSALAAYGVTFNSLTATQQGAINSRGGPTAATVGLQQQVNNASKLIVNGLEFQLIQSLDFATSLVGLKGFGVQANATIIDQKGPTAATGVPDYTYTATAYYDRGGISARLAYTYYAVSAATTDNQNNIPAATIYNNAYGQLDFSSSIDLAKVLDSKNLPTLTLDVINLNKANQRQYFQFQNAAWTFYKPGRTIMIGLRGKF